MTDSTLKYNSAVNYGSIFKPSQTENFDVLTVLPVAATKIKRSWVVSSTLEHLKSTMSYDQQNGLTSLKIYHGVEMNLHRVLKIIFSV